MHVDRAMSDAIKELTAAIRAKLARNELRYPVEKARGTNRKYTEL